MIIPRPNQNHLTKKHNIYTRDTKNFDREHFLLDILSIDWEFILDNNDVNKPLNNFLHLVNSIIDRYMPFKKITNKEYKRKYKPWVTTGILKSITRKTNYLKDMLDVKKIR